MNFQRERDPANEREEIRAYAAERPEPNRRIVFNEEIGRIPPGPASGARERARRAKSCAACEGDLWIEDESGCHIPCSCRERRAAKRAANRLRAGNWWYGTSLSFAAPPLSATPGPTRDAVERLCAEVKRRGRDRGLWLVGGGGSCKSALCAYVAQRLYPTNDAIAERTGDLLAHLRWLGGVRGELAVEERLERLTETPLLVLDDLDRPERSYQGQSPLTLQESCTSLDLIRLATLIRDRQAAARPTMVTTRCQPVDCGERTAAVTRPDLVRGLVAIAADQGSAFEDFPSYTAALLEGGVQDLRESCETHTLEGTQLRAQAA